MLWLSRPPYLAWAAVVLIAIVTLWIELRPSPVTTHPFVVEAVASGQPIDGSVEMRTVPGGVLEQVDPAGFAARPLAAGEPLLPSDIASVPFTIPEGWWTIDLALPATATTGDAIQLVVLPRPGEPTTVPVQGVVARPNGTGSFGDTTPGAAAFPPDDAAFAAIAVAEGRASILVAAGLTWDFANSG